MIDTPMERETMGSGMTKWQYITLWQSKAMYEQQRVFPDEARNTPVEALCGRNGGVENETAGRLCFNSQNSDICWDVFELQKL